VLALLQLVLRRASLSRPDGEQRRPFALRDLLALPSQCVLAVDRWPDDVTVPSFGPRMAENLRGICVWYQIGKTLRKSGLPHQNVQYVGMATAGTRRGVRGRLISHRQSKRKGDLWTHFSVFQVWDNIRDDEVAEPEGFFRHIYRRNLHANRLNIQRGFNGLTGRAQCSVPDNGAPN
jgi:hypothetical protein